MNIASSKDSLFRSVVKLKCVVKKAHIFSICVYYKSLSMSPLNKDDPFTTTYLAKILQRNFLSTGTLAAMTKCTSTLLIEAIR